MATINDYYYSGCTNVIYANHPLYSTLLDMYLPNMPRSISLNGMTFQPQGRGILLTFKIVPNDSRNVFPHIPQKAK